MSIDLLRLAGEASEVLERYGFVACGRRVDGQTRVDLWTPDGVAYQHVLTGTEVSVDEIVAACLALVPPADRGAPARGRLSDLN